MAYYAEIIIDISHEKVDRTFQYRVPEELRNSVEIGTCVEIPFGKGNRLRRGYVVELGREAHCDVSRIKSISGIARDNLAVQAKMISLAAWIRKNYGGTMNQALKTVLPVKKKENEKEKRLVVLTLEQEEAEKLLEELVRKHRTARARLLEALIRDRELPYEAVTGKLNVTAAVIRAMAEGGILRVDRYRTYRNPLGRLKKQESTVRLNEIQQKIADAVIRNQEAGDLRPSLIYGVTGSGKTEIYMELIGDTVKKGKQAIVLIPEIALTFQTVMRFYNRFGDRVSILNSRMSPGERFDQYERAKNGELDVMIGPRSALFTPFPDLGYIIIDEEHEGTYKSETVPRYHARETAIERARQENAQVVLGSATPSVESFKNALEGKYHLYEMPRRVAGRNMAKVYIEDLREELRKGNRTILSDRLRELMCQRLEKKEQIMLFINRRGVAGFVSCRSCGHVIKCPHCDVSLSLHNNGRMVCHYCGYEQPAVKQCPECGSRLIGTFKAGTQKIEAWLKQEFPQAGILRMDLDTTRSKDGYEKILSAFANGEADILIGTQMIVKGHDFPNVTLVGVLAADLSLHANDYRAAERTFQLLTQAAGRAGRGKSPGEVVIQTYQPEHYSIQAAGRQDYRGFYQQEMNFRKLLRYPPVWNMLVIHISSGEEELAEGLAGRLKAVIDEKKARQMQVIGPASPTVARINDIYKRVIYVKHPEYECLVEIKDRLELFLKDKKEFEKASVQFDFNPMNGF